MTPTPTPSAVDLAFQAVQAGEATVAGDLAQTPVLQTQVSSAQQTLSTAQGLLTANQTQTTTDQSSLKSLYLALVTAAQAAADALTTPTS